MGNPIDPLFTDREVFADFFTRYYTDWEPESCLVAQMDGQVVGYLTGCLRYRSYPAIQKFIISGIIVPKVLLRLATLKYDEQDAQFLRWVMLRAMRETPKCPPKAAHFHINILRPWRNKGAARKLIFSFLDSLAHRGMSQVYGQIQTYEDRRAARLFERYGFKLYDQRRVTKFNTLHSKEVYVSTFFKEL
jgi:GNAT superfamily N-acetyltransferase